MNNQQSLPPGIEERWDPTQQRFFYINHNTKTTSWERPVAPPPSAARSAAGPSTVPPTNFYSPAPKTSQVPFVPPASALQSAPSVQQQQQLQYSQPPVSQQQQQQYGLYPSMSESPGAFVPQQQAQQPAAPVSHQPFGSIGSIMPVQQVPLALQEPSWDQKQTGVGCSSCAKEFTFLNRRHRCRCCFREFCGNCTSKNHPVGQFGHTTPVRVCDACHSHLSGNRKRCLSRLVPYFERDNIPDSRRMEALGEAYDLLTSGVEILEEAPIVGIFGPLFHVVEVGGAEKPNLTVKALSMISVLTTLDSKNCVKVLEVPKAVPTLVGACKSKNPQIRMLASEIVCGLAREEQHVAQILEADYMSFALSVLSGAFADAKLLEVVSETLVCVVKVSNDVRQTLQDTPVTLQHLLGCLVNGSMTCQRHVVEVLTWLSTAAILQADGAALLVPLIRTHHPHNRAVLTIVHNLCLSEGGGEVLLKAGVLRELIPEEPDPLLAVLKLLEMQKNNEGALTLVKALLPVVTKTPLAGQQICETNQVGLLTAVLRDHFAEDVKLLILKVLSDLSMDERAVKQIVDSGGLYDIVNHLPGASVSIQTAQLSVLQSMMRHSYCVTKATDAGAVQALVPLSVPPCAPLIRQLAAGILASMCEDPLSDARLVVVGVATPATVVNHFVQTVEGLRLIRVLLGDPATSADLLEAGIFGNLMSLITTGGSAEVRALAASALSLCIQHNTDTVDPKYISSLAELMRLNGPEVGVELCAAFSSQPVYRRYILEQGMVPALIALLLGGSPESLGHSVLALANLAYEEEGSKCILREGGVSVFVGLINHPSNQVQGCTVLALGNLGRVPECRALIVRDGGVELVVDKFVKTEDSVIQHYCLWALRTLVLEKGVPEMIASLGAVSLIFPKLGPHMRNQESRSNALAFCGVMCAVPSFCQLLSASAIKEEVTLALLQQDNDGGREWAMKELEASGNNAAWQSAPGYGDAVNGLLASSVVSHQLSGLRLAERSLGVQQEKTVVAAPLVLDLLRKPETTTSAARVVALMCLNPSMRVKMRDATNVLVELMFAGNPDAATSVSLLCRDPENVSFMLKSGVVLKFAATVSTPTSAEALEFLCANSAECRATLCNMPSFVQQDLLPCCRERGNPSAFAILRSLAKDPAFKSQSAVSGVCSALLLSSLVDEELVSTLATLRPGDLYKEGALSVAIGLLVNENNTMRLKIAALNLLQHLSMSIEAFSGIVAVPNVVSALLQFASSEGPALVLLEKLMWLPKHRQAFLDAKGIEGVLKASEAVYAEAAAVCLAVLRDFSLNPGNGTELCLFAQKIIESAKKEAKIGPAQILALDLLKQLSNANTCVASVRSVLENPNVQAVVRGSPLLMDMIRFYFVEKLTELE